MAIPPNVITPVMLIELPTPGVTGALGVAPAGQSWMELQNAATSIIDIHDHSGNGKGLPIVATSIDINADLPFNGFSAVEVGSIGLEARGATMVGPYSLRVYSYNGDFYFTNADGYPVQITAGKSIAGAVGTISGMIPGSSVRYDLPTGSFIFEKASNVIAGIKAGPLFLTVGAGAGGNTIGISAPSGLAAGYSLTLPTALPGVTKLLTLSAAGAVASTIWVDGTTIQVSGSAIIGKAVGMVTRALNGVTSSTTAVAVPGGSVVVTNVAGRPNMVMLQPTAFAGSGVIVGTKDKTFPHMAYIELIRVDSGGTTTRAVWSFSAPANAADVSVPGGRISASVLSFVDTVSTPGTYTYSLTYYTDTGSSPASTATDITVQSMTLVAFEV